MDEEVRSSYLLESLVATSIFPTPPRSCLTKERSDQTNDRAISSGFNGNADGDTMELG